MVSLSIPDLISGLVFIGMGVLTAWLAFGNKLAMQSGLQVSINIWTTKFLNSIKGITDLLPQSWWAVLFVFFFLGLAARVIYLFKREQSYEQKQ